MQAVMFRGRGRAGLGGLRPREGARTGGEVAQTEDLTGVVVLEGERSL